MTSKYKYPNIAPPPLDPEPQSGARLGQKVETAFTRFLQRIIRWGWEFTADLLVDIADNVFKILRPGMARMGKATLDEALKMPNLPPYIRATLQAINSEQGESSFWGHALLVLAGLAGIFGGFGGPGGRAISYWVDAQLRTGRPSPTELVEMFKRGNVSPADFDLYMQDLGIPNDVKASLLQFYDNRANPDDLIFGLLRGLVSEGEFKVKLSKAGVPAHLHDIYLEQSKLIPPVSDLIRMMVRDAFNPAIVQKFGYDEEYPSAINEYIAKQGLSPEWGQKYWFSHWQLPSPTQAYEMLHRGLITQEDIDTLLKTADYPKYWREKLVAISYNPLTRVDVRRLLQAGVIDREKAKREYMAMGNSPENAEILTKFAEMGASTKEKDLTQAQVIGLYKDGLQTRSNTKEDLIKMGFDMDEAEDLLKRADKDLQDAERTDRINYVEERYLSGQIDKPQAANELALAGLSQVATDRRLLEFDRRKEAAKAIPTQAEARSFALAGIITIDEYRDILKLRNYEQKYIDWYIAAIQIKLEGPEEGIV